MAKTKPAPRKARAQRISEALVRLAVAIDTIAPDPDNARDHGEDNLRAIRASLRKFGQRKPIVVNRRTGQIEAGHGLWEAAKALGWQEIAAVFVDEDPERQREFSIADNRTAELATWSEDRLQAALLKIDSTDSDLYQDLLLADLARSEPPASQDAPEPQIDRAETLRKKWKTKTGQVWIIPGKAGEHRVLCGDCREITGQLGDATIDMIFTDPPYGHNNNNGDLIARWEAALGQGEYKPGETDRPIANDGPEANELVRKVFAEAARILKPGCCCCCCCCGGGGPDPQFARWSLWLDEAIPFKMCVVWDKGGLGMGWHYRRCWECILVGMKPGAACNWHGGKDVPNIIRDIGKIIPSADQHPTEKPPALAEWFLRLHSAEAEIILDPFLGSGSTLVACEQLGRVGIGIEIEPKHVAVALQRMNDMGLKPRLEKK